MHGFINSPALAKLVALQMVDEELQRNPSRPSRATRAPLASAQALHADPPTRIRVRYSPA